MVIFGFLSRSWLPFFIKTQIHAIICYSDIYNYFVHENGEVFADIRLSVICNVLIINVLARKQHRKAL